MTLTVKLPPTKRTLTYSVNTIVVEKGKVTVTLADGSKMDINPNLLSDGVTYTFN
jgi:hypothetical protein